MQLRINRQRSFPLTALNIVIHNVTRAHLGHEPVRLERVQVPQDPEPIQQPNKAPAQIVCRVLD